MDIKWKTEQRKVSELIPYDKNPRRLTEEQEQRLTESLKKFDLAEIPAINTDGTIIAGHQRIKILLKLGKGDEVVDVRVPSRKLTDEEYKEYNLRSNKNTGEWDFELLKDFGAELLTDVGFTEEEMGEIFPLDLEPNEKEDEVPEVRETDIKLGDMYQLGGHRLLCGDATKFCHKMYEIFKEFNTGDIYMWGASGPEGMRMRLWLVEMGCHWSATIVWKKQQLVLSPAKYQRMYEPCFYGWFGKSTFGADRKQTEVWEIDRPLNSKLHPTMKPIELCEKPILNSSKWNDIVLDVFGGSGSTLIACEKTNRKCRMMELDPVYCQVIIDRWEQFTGQKAEKI